MLEWDIKELEDGIRVRFIGAFTEVVRLDSLEIQASKVTFDFCGVRRINSVGVKRLLAFLEALGPETNIHAERCSPAIVAQLNLVSGLASRMTIHSVMAPLECTSCVAEADVLVDPGPGPEPPIMAERACEVCGAEMVLAELESRYFSFLLPD